MRRYWRGPRRIAEAVWFAGLLAAAMAPAAPPSRAQTAPAPDVRDDQFSVAYQINPAHSGAITLDVPFQPPLTLRWSQKADGPLSYPLIARGKVFIYVSYFPTNRTGMPGGFMRSISRPARRSGSCRSPRPTARRASPMIRGGFFSSPSTGHSVPTMPTPGHRRGRCSCRVRRSPTRRRRRRTASFTRWAPATAAPSTRSMKRPARCYGSGRSRTAPAALRHSPATVSIYPTPAASINSIR